MPYFPTFGLNTEKYSVSLRIQSKCEKMWTKVTPNTDTFYTVLFLLNLPILYLLKTPEDFLKFSGGIK